MSKPYISVMFFCRKEPELIMLLEIMHCVHNLQIVNCLLADN